MHEMVNRRVVCYCVHGTHRMHRRKAMQGTTVSDRLPHDELHPQFRADILEALAEMDAGAVVPYEKG